MAKYKPEVLSRDSYEEWNCFVEDSPQGSIFTNTHFLDSTQKEYHIRVIRENGNIIAGIPIIKNEIKLYWNPMFVKHLGILLPPRKSKRSKWISKEMNIVQSFVEDTKSFRSFSYKFHPSFDNWLPFYWNGFRQETYYTYRINLAGSFDSIVSEAETRARTDMKKALKNDITVKEIEDIDLFYKICSGTYTHMNTKPPYSKNLVESFYNHLKPVSAVKYFGAFNSDGECRAVSGIIYDENEAFLILNGQTFTGANDGANTLLIFENIRTMQGLSKVFDFEGSMIPAIEKFYRSFGGELVPFYKITRKSLINYAMFSAIGLYKKIKGYDRG